MKTALIFLLLTGYCHAQTPASVTRRDSMPGREKPSAPRLPDDRMPIVRPNTSFYRLKTDPKNVVRATNDNMPVKTPDSSTYYTMLYSSRSPYQYQVKPFTRPVAPQPYIHSPRKRH